MIEEKPIEKFYDEEGKNGVGGFLLLFVAWLYAVNPLLIIYNVNPMISYIDKQLRLLHFPAAPAIYYLNLGLMIAFILASIVIGIGVNRLQKGFWNYAQLYLILTLIFTLAEIFICLSFVTNAIQHGTFSLPPRKLGPFLDDFNFKIWTTLVIFGVWHLYLNKSHTVKVAFGLER